jgi:AAA15 family ATPase/GTPase
MLNSLSIKNYRNLENFKIDSVDQINLITGKNNTGKSTILEAIATYASKGDIENLLAILKRRGELLEDDLDIKNRKILSFASFFNNRKYDFTKDEEIIISEIAIGNYVHSMKYGKEEKTLRIYFRNNSESKIYAIDEPAYFYKNPDVKSDNFQLVTSGEINNSIGAVLFDKIVLTERENYVINALKIIEHEAERIAFINEEKSVKRKPVIKLSNASDTIPLQSMGDGINRILTIILAAVNCENGYLLIDEFENGLHYSVQEKLWKIIFKLAKDLNIQVFATTHSNDCINSFSKVLNEENNEVTGKLIRLENIDGEIKPAEYSPDELRIANKHNIETR